MAKDIVKLFEDPPCAFRGKPFWSWNGKLDPEELRREIRAMKTMGLGGFFMHSRVGLDTPYLSDEWMECVGACVDEARKLEMEAWLYDEDRWPSGAAGGFVTKDKRFRQRHVVSEEATPAKYKPSDDNLAVFAARMKGDAVSSYRRLSGKEKPKKGEKALIFRVEVAPDNPNFNNQAYLDTMNPEAVKKFIDVTHEAYRKNFGDEFGKLIPGIFTDEPEYGRCRVWGNQTKQLSWTDKFPAEFKKRFGYDIIDYLPEVFYDIEGEPVSRARYHYHECATAMFVEAFAKQIGDWCEKYNLLFTGHVMAEENMRSQLGFVGSAMRFYEHMQAPGMDLLTEVRPEYDTAKQCASVLRQSGRKWMLSELYGCTGWDFPFEGHKAIGDWQAALGVNLRCQHLYWYTMLGQAKRDYPAAIGHQSPWWKHYPAVEDYFSRLNVLLSEGEPVRDLLVIHPMESAWTRFVTGEQGQEDVASLDKMFVRLRNILLESHVDFDYGDEEMISRLASVKKGKDGVQFILGKAAYKAIILPPALTVRGTTLKLLKKFAEAGGKVIVVGDAPSYVDAVPSSEVAELAACDCVTKCADSPASIARAVESARAVNIVDADGREIKSALYQLRKLDDGHALFICNTDRKNDAPNVRIIIQGKDAEEWDAATGERFRAETSDLGEAMVISTSLPPSGSRLFIIRDGAVKGLKERPALEHQCGRTISTERWNIQRDEQNVFVLDKPEWRLDGGNWRKPLEILKIDQQCRDALGLKRRGGSMVQPWARPKDVKGPSGLLELRYMINVKTVPDGPVELAIEQPEKLDIELNEKKVEMFDDAGWWVDRSLRRVPLDSALLVKGENLLVVRMQLDRDNGPEICYLLGEFGARAVGDSAEMTTLPEKLKIGDWTKQGLPFYSGSVTYTCSLTNPAKKGERLFLELPKWAGSCVRVTVNGEPAGVMAWPPYELNLTHVAGDGKIELGITVVSHRRNSHGPLHLERSGKKGWTGPAEFVTEGEAWSDAYKLVPTGLLASPKLSIRK